MKKALVLVCSCLSLAACGGEVTLASAAAGASVGEGGRGGAGGGGEGGGGADAGGGGSATIVCVPQPDGAGGFTQPTCADLGGLVVAAPFVTDADGDGVVSSGESALIEASLSEVAGVGFSWYPGVLFQSDDPAVEIEGQDWYYAIFACQTHPVKAQATFNVPSGTKVTITARVSMLNHDCPEAYAIDIPITVH